MNPMNLDCIWYEIFTLDSIVSTYFIGYHRAVGGDGDPNHNAATRRACY